MTKFYMLLTVILLSTGCSQHGNPFWQEEIAETNRPELDDTKDDSQDEIEQTHSDTVLNSVKFHDEYGRLLQSKDLARKARIESQLTPQVVTNEPLEKNINYYVRGLMQDLVGNLQYVNASTPIGVTTFPLLDGDYNQSNLLAKQVAESFIHEVHKFGIPVIDFKTTDYIRVTTDGDFVLSQDYLELKDGLPIRYVIAGTMVEHQGGFLVNARILGIESKAVVASAQGVIPKEVASALYSSKKVVVEPEVIPVVSLVKGKEYH